MSLIRELIDAMFGRHQPPPDTESRVLLDRQERQTADRLSKLTGKRRDEVLREAYRNADQTYAAKR